MGNVSGDYGMDVAEWDTRSPQNSVSIWNEHKMSVGYNAEEAIDFHRKILFVHESDTSQSIEVDARTETDRDGNTNVQASGTYEIRQESDSNSTSESLTIYGNVDNEGNVSGGVEIKITHEF